MVHTAFTACLYKHLSQLQQALPKQQAKHTFNELLLVLFFVSSFNLAAWKDHQASAKSHAQQQRDKYTPFLIPDAPMGKCKQANGS